MPRSKTQITGDRAGPVFSRVYEESSIGFALLDSSLRTVDANRACRRMLGLANALPVSILSYLNAPPDAWERASRGDPIRFQSVLRVTGTSKPDSVTLDVELIPIPAPRRTSRGACLVQIADMTEQKRAENALRESEELYRRVLDLTDAGIARFDLAGRRTFANEVLIRRLGESADVLLEGMVADHVAPDDRREAERLFQQCLDTGRPIRGLVSRHIQNGRSFWSRSDYTPIFDRDGQMVGVQSTSVDVTELIETQDYLRHALDERDRLHQITREMIKVVEMDRLLESICGSIVDAVGARMVWVGLTDSRSGETEPVVLQEGADAAPCSGGDLLQRIRAAESSRDLSKRAFRLLVGNEVVGVLNVYCDVEQALDKELESKVEVFADAAALAIRNARLHEAASSARSLAQLNEMKSRLLSTVSHELRTPVGAIRGYAQLMLSYNGRLSASENRENLMTIDEEASRLEEMIGALLDVSKLEAGVLKISCAPVKLRPFLENVVTRFFRAVSTHNLVLELPRRLPTASIDRHRIAQVLENLLDNAIKYSPAGTEIMVEARKSGDVALVSVHDQGVGISVEDLERVFEPFYRAEAGPGDDPGGAGLGLTICKGLVDAHHGRIWAEQDANGGSVFHFTLPLASLEDWPGGQPLAKA